MGSFVLQSASFLEILASGNKSFSFGGKTELYHRFYLEAEGRDETLRKLKFENLTPRGYLRPFCTSFCKSMGLESKPRSCLIEVCDLGKLPTLLSSSVNTSSLNGYL